MEANHARTGAGTKRARPLAGRAGVASFALSEEEEEEEEEEAVESSSCFSSASVVFGSSSDPASDAFAEAARATRARRGRARGATRRVPNVARGGGAARRPRTRATGRATTATANIFKI